MSQRVVLGLTVSLLKVFLDFVIRMVVIESHVAAQWVEASNAAKEKEAQDQMAVLASKEAESTIAKKKQPGSMTALFHLFLNRRALVSNCIAFAFGIYVGAVVDGSSTLR